MEDGLLNDDSMDCIDMAVIVEGVVVVTVVVVVVTDYFALYRDYFLVIVEGVVEG